ILEVPIGYLTSGTEPVIGGGTTSSIRQTQGYLARPRRPVMGQGAGAQGSRPGPPPGKGGGIGGQGKGKVNASGPRHGGQFLEYVTNPTLPALIQSLFPGVAAPCTPRNDLVQVFLTGVPGLNQPAHVRGAEMLRLNTGTAPTARSAQNR